MNFFPQRVSKTIGCYPGIKFAEKVQCCFSSAVSIKDKEFPPNSSLVPAFVHNRNPRNLEKLRIGDKPDGWNWEKPGRLFWNKVTFEVTGRHISGSIVHFQGYKPASASTTEWCIKKFLYSTNDTPAAAAVGKILAYRCLQVGITEVACFFAEEERTKEKTSIFLNALEDGGITLSEPEQFIVPVFLNAPTLPEKGWDVVEELDEDIIKILHEHYKKS